MNSLQTIPANADEVMLVRYERARTALAEAAAVDEVLNFRTEADMMRAYAKQANNTELEAKAAEIRLRAGRRLGELIAAQKEAGLLSTGAKGQLVGPGVIGGLQSNPPIDAPPTLSEVGIDKNLAHEARSLAKIPPQEFEQKIEDMKEHAAATGRVRVSIVRDNVVPIRSPEQERRFMKHLEDQLDAEEDDGGSFLLTATPQQKASSYNGWMTGLPLLDPDPALIVADLLHVTNPAHVAAMEKVVDLNLEIAAKIKEIFDVRKHSLR
jgi:hypothetical protein